MVEKDDTKKKKKPGRETVWTLRIALPLNEPLLARIDAARKPDEPRLDLIRSAIESELKRRESGKG